MGRRVKFFSTLVALALLIVFAALRVNQFLDSPEEQHTVQIFLNKAKHFGFNSIQGIERALRNMVHDQYLNYRKTIEHIGVDPAAREFARLMREEMAKDRREKGDSPFVVEIHYNGIFGALKIKDHFTEVIESEGKRLERYKEEVRLFDVYALTTVWLLRIVVPYPQVKSFQYELVWKDRTIFKVKTNRTELEHIDVYKIEDDYKRFVANLKRKEMWDPSREQEYQMQHFYRKIFGGIRSKEVSPLIEKG